MRYKADECSAHEAKIIYWSLYIEQNSAEYREDEGWSLLALMEDDTDLEDTVGKKWFPKPADPGMSPMITQSAHTCSKAE